MSIFLYLHIQVVSIPTSPHPLTRKPIFYVYFLFSTSPFFSAQKEQDKILSFTKIRGWASLVVQWSRVCLPVQGTQVRALVWEDPTCRGAAEPVRHNY